MSDPSVAASSISELAALVGQDIATAAISAGVSPTLIERVDAGRQPFPRSKVADLARVFDVSEGTVIAACSSVVEDANAPASVVVRPIPPNPIFGESFPSVPINATSTRAPVRVASSLIVWVVGQNVGNVGPIGGFGRIDRNRATLLPTIASTKVDNPVFLARGTNAIYTVGTTAFEGSPYVTAVDKNGAVLYETAIDTIWNPLAIEYEPVCGCLYISVKTHVIRLNPNTGEWIADVELIHEGNAYSPRGIHAANGKLYVAATFAVSEVDSIGRVFEIDPVTVTIVRVSSGANVRNGSDLAFDGSGVLYVVSGGVDNPAPGLYIVPLASFVASFVPLSGGDPLVNPTRIVYAFGHAFVSELTGANVPKLVKISSSGVIEAERVFVGATSLGKPGVDPVLLWVPNPNDGTVTMIAPETLDDLLSFDVSGEPRAVQVLSAGA